MEVTVNIIQIYVIIVGAYMLLTFFKEFSYQNFMDYVITIVTISIFYLAYLGGANGF